MFSSLRNKHTEATDLLSFVKHNINGLNNLINIINVGSQPSRDITPLVNALKRTIKTVCGNMRTDRYDDINSKLITKKNS
jgi:hypothetical protein